MLWWSRYEVADRYDGQTLLDPTMPEFWAAQQRDFQARLDALTAGGAVVVAVLTEPPGVGMHSRCSAQKCPPILERMVLHDEYRTRWNDIMTAQADTDPRLFTISLDDVICTTPPPGGTDFGAALCDDTTPSGTLRRPDGSHFDLEAVGDEVGDAVLTRLLAAVDQRSGATSP